MENENDILNQNLDFNKERSIETADRVIIPVIKEEIVVDKKMVDKATVKLSKTISEDLEEVAVPLIDEDVIVEVFPKNEILEVAPPSIRYEGDVMIISVTKEVAVVEKRLMLVKELHVKRSITEHSETHKMMLRKEEVTVERTEINNPDAQL